MALCQVASIATCWPPRVVIPVALVLNIAMYLILRANGKIEAARVDKGTGEWQPLSVSSICRAIRQLGLEARNSLYLGKVGGDRKIDRINTDPARLATHLRRPQLRAFGQRASCVEHEPHAVHRWRTRRHIDVQAPSKIA